MKSNENEKLQCHLLNATATQLDLSNLHSWQSSTHVKDTHDESWFAASLATDGNPVSNFDLEGVVEWSCSLTHYEIFKFVFYVKDITCHFFRLFYRAKFPF